MSHDPSLHETVILIACIAAMAFMAWARNR